MVHEPSPSYLEPPQMAACALCDGNGHRCFHCDGDGVAPPDDAPDLPLAPRSETPMLAEAKHTPVSVRANSLPAETAPPASEDAAMLMMIERAARDPSVDVDKMERLMAMAERGAERRAKMAFASALAELQPKLPVIDERGAIRTDKDKTKAPQSTYAKWEDINDAIRPILHQHGFALNFRINRTDGLVSVTGVLSHRDGHSEHTTLDLPVDASGSKNGVQAVGSSVSYGKRYTAIALLNITSRAKQDRDDDGRAADPNHWINEDQLGTLVALMDEVRADRTKFLNFLRLDTLAHLPRVRYDEAVGLLEQKRGAR